ncbi:type VII secretion protein EssC [Streptococcus sp. H31]|uniref:type VII secretion protein EssC n=1 Tax=Streptococcus huangxiaojuni TaxID=3237239 RepID=UPI0034A36376
MKGYLPIYIGDLRYELTIDGDGEHFVLGNDANASVYLAELSHPLVIACQKGSLFYQFADDQPQPLELPADLTDRIRIEKLQDQPSTVVDVLDKQRISVNPDDLLFDNEDVQLLFFKKTSSWELSVFAGTVYINNQKLRQDKIDLAFGDEVTFGSKKIKLLNDELHLWGESGISGQLIKRTESRYHFYPGYPDYHRSPRLIYRGSEEKLEVKAPPQEPRKPTDQLLKLIIPPLMMIGITILITLIQPRGIYILMTISMSAVTLVFSISNYIRNRKQYKIDLADRIESYQAYLSDKSIELRKKAEEYRKGRLYHYPDLPAIDSLLKEYHHRIYEKTPLHFDFLYYRLGLGRIKPSYKLAYSEKERNKKTDDLEKEGFALYERNRKVSDVPVIANLVNGPVGYIGERALVIEQLQLMLTQLAFFHSYHDVQFIPIFPEEEKAEWDWLRWLPHARLQELNVRGFVYNQRTRDQVLNSLNQILKDRQTQKRTQKNGQENILFSPHYVVLITDEKLTLDHGIMEFFNEDPTELGCSVIFVQDVLSSLSENVKTIIDIKDVNYAELVIEEGELKNLDIALDHFPENFDKESISRRLAPLNHLQNLKSSIPESVTFLELYQTEDFQGLRVPERWEQNNPYKSLAVPLGLRGQDDIVYLNLHEKAHGPHGLIAGTTGSGKSELIQSYILSLAVNFHPHDVAFLLIDYKGGGMANLFKDLPHLLGTITNLDGNQSMRALASIKAELRRRQNLFAQAEVNHINQYQKKYQLGEVDEPLPHLFLISDEFAELKADQPDFMTELVSTARIGRSIGIHLILATQKPSGVVNDQIWSNSRFKIALKVAERADSQEMLKTSDAANITQAGRAYLQVGNNEIYELFQSAWSGADYEPDKTDQGIEDNTIYAINNLGQYEVLNDDLSGLEEVDDIREVPTELGVVVNRIQTLTKELGIKQLAQPWLPPLEERVYLEELYKEGYTAYDACLGLVDIPNEQAQRVAIYNPVLQGNLLLLSQPGMGKSTFLQTLIMSLATRHTPEEIHFYLLDFGTNGLLPLRDLPHVADLITADDEEKISKFMRRMNTVMTDRKDFLKAQGVANSAMYREQGHVYPQIIIILDNFEGLKDNPQYDAMEALIQLLARDGNALGITVVITAGRLSALKGALQANMRERIILKITEESDSKSIIGRHNYTMEDIPGRGLIRYDNPEIFQTALPAYGKTGQDVLMALQEKIEQMDRDWTGQRPEPIALVPELLTLQDFRLRSSVQFDISNGALPIGLNTETVENVTIPLTRLKHVAMISDTDEHLVNITRHLIDVLSLLENKSIMLFDTEKFYEDLADKVKTYVTEPKEVTSRLNQLILELERRETTDEAYKEWFGIIPDFQSFVSQTNLDLDMLQTIFEHGPKVQMHLFAGSPLSYLGNNAGDIPKYYRQNASHFLFGMRMIDQVFLPKTYNSKEPYLSIDTIYLHNRRKEQLVKITKPEGD